jgi:hypothetical protein
MIWVCRRIDSTMRLLPFTVSNSLAIVAVEVVAALRVFTGEHGKVCI